MSEPRYRDWILETIDSLRSRKARPDLERICRMVRRRHGLEPDRTRSELEKLIQEQAVLKVNYKGSVSYRNAAKVQRKSRKKTAQTGDCALQAQTARDGARTRADRAPTADSGLTGASRPGDPEASASPAAKRREMTFAPTVASCGAGERGRTPCRASESGAHRDEMPQTRGRKRALSPAEDAVNDNETDAPGRAQAARERDRPTGTGTCASAAAQRKLRHAQRPRTEPGPQPGAEAHGNRRVDACDTFAALVPSPADGERDSVTSSGAAPGTDPQGDGVTRSQVEEEPRRELDSARRGASSPVENELVTMETDTCEDEAEHEEEDIQGGGATLPGDQGSVLQTPPASESSPCLRDGTPQSENDAHITGGNLSPNRKKESCSPTPMVAKEEVCSHERCPSLCSPAVDSLTGAQKESGDPEAGLQPRAVYPSVQREAIKVEEEVPVEECAVTPDQLESDVAAVQDQVMRGSGGGQASFTAAQGYLDCKTSMDATSCLLTPTASPGGQDIATETRMTTGVYLKMGRDPAQWTVADVVSYFSAAGFPEQAVAFQTQEIDGKSLLLMQRSDVLTGLSIRLGPALKIYEFHVKELQRTHFEDDGSLCLTVYLLALVLSPP
ncbi:polycomb protein Scm-like [Arapaima gigas]